MSSPHSFQETGHGDKKDKSGCSCGLLMDESGFGNHKWFQDHPEYKALCRPANSGIQYQFQHWLDNGWSVKVG